MESVYGISPFSAAFEVIGLTNCKVLMDFLYKTNFLKIAFGVGFLLCLKDLYQTGSYKPLIGYMIMFLFTWTLFVVMPSSPRPTVTSTMEKLGGYTKTTAEGIYKENSKSAEVSPVIAFIGKTYNIIINGTIQVVTNITNSEDMNYLKNPFMFNKMVEEASNFATSGIDEPGLRRRVDEFLDRHYRFALAEIINNKVKSGDYIRNLWPGHKDITIKYDEEGKKEWVSLNEEIIDYVKKALPWWVTILTKLNYKIKNDKNAAYNPVIKQLFKSRTQYFIKRDKGISRSSDIAETITFAGSIWEQIPSFIKANGAFKSLPYIEGYVILVMYSTFPFVLCFAYLFRKPDFLIRFFRYTFIIKFWNVLWAVIYYASVNMAQVQASIIPGYRWILEKPYFNNVTNYMVIATPILAFFIFEGGLGWLSGSLGAAGVLAQKSMGTVMSGTEAIKKLAK